MEGQKLLTVKDLKTYFYTSGGVSKAVDGVSFEVEKGEKLLAGPLILTVRMSLS